MIISSIKMQMHEMMRKKTVIFTYCILLFFVLINFFMNVYNNNNIQYISQMYDPMKVLTLSNWSVSGFFMMYFYPILVVLPTATCYLIDYDSKVKIYIQSKTGSFNYWYGKLISVFLTTFFIFTIPFILEILLSYICFSSKSIGDPSGFSYLQTIENENQYFLSQIWLNNKIIYTALLTLLFGVVSGIFATFNFAITSLSIFKYKIFTFFPIYVLFYSISIIELFINIKYTLSYMLILNMFEVSEKNYLIYTFFLICMLLVSIVLIGIKAKRDDSL